MVTKPRTDLTHVREIQRDCMVLSAEVDDVTLLGDDGRKSPQFAAHTRKMHLLADRLELAAALVRHELWYARGEKDVVRGE